MNTGLGMTNFGANLINKKSNRMDFCYYVFWVRKWPQISSRWAKPMLLALQLSKPEYLTEESLFRSYSLFKQINGFFIIKP